MSTTVAILPFCGGGLLSLMSSVVLSERLDQVGHRFRLPPGLIGLVTALGADSPEISSATAAIIGGQHDLGREVIFGSNIFNGAMLLGLSAVVAGWVAMGRANLGFNAGVALCLTPVVGAQTLGVRPFWRWARCWRSRPPPQGLASPARVSDAEPGCCSWLHMRPTVPRPFGWQISAAVPAEGQTVCKGARPWCGLR